MWKGSKVGYTALHQWVRNRVSSDNHCQKCGNFYERLDLANISGLYKRDLSDWEYLCRKCHMIKDGRLYKFIKLSKSRKNKAKYCIKCGSSFYHNHNPKQKYCSYYCSSNDRDYSSRKGEGNGNNILKIEDVFYIRSSNLSRKELSKIFKVSYSTITAIIGYKIWKDI